MSIATELTRIATAKAAIKAAINAKGGTLTTETLDDYAAAISAIQTGGGGGGSASFYKCASVGSGTWTGYKAVWNSASSKYEFESALTSDTLTFTMVTPEVGKVYSADALINASLWVGIPTAGLVFHASLNNGAVEIGNAITNQSGSISYTTVDGIPCGSCDKYWGLSNSGDAVPSGNDPRTMSMWYRYNNSLSYMAATLLFELHDRETHGEPIFTLCYRDGEHTGGLCFYGGDFQGPTVLNDNRWHHLCGSYDGTTAKYYVDGVLDAQSVMNVNTRSGSYIAIGDGGWYLDGYIAGLRIYNRALSAAEIAALAGEFKLYDVVS